MKAETKKKIVNASDDCNNNIEVVNSDLDVNSSEERPGVGYEITGNVIGIGTEF